MEQKNTRENTEMSEVINSTELFIEQNKKKIIIDSRNMKETTIQEDLMRKVRSSVIIAGALLSRFREAYSLIRDREAKSVMEAIKYSMNLMFSYELNPAIIAACKTENQLQTYLDCLTNNKLDEFKEFEIKFEVAPLKAVQKQDML